LEWVHALAGFAGALLDVLASLDVSAQARARLRVVAGIGGRIPGAVRAAAGRVRRSLSALAFAVEIGAIGRLPSPAKLVGYSGLLPRLHQSGASSRIGRLSKAGSPLAGDRSMRTCCAAAPDEAGATPRCW
jgi:transposase